MFQPIRNVPAGGSVVEISHRCLQARFLLNPSGRVNELVLGVLAKAQKRFGVTIYLSVVLSNHLHLLIWASDARQMARFMNFVASNIAREIGRLHGWRGKFWDGPYTAVLVASDEATLVSRLRYFLAHGCKENLVSKPREWPGVHPAKMLLSNKPCQGVWVDRTALYRARLNKRPGSVKKIDFEQQTTLKLTQLPCWADLTPEEYRAQIRAEVAAIEAETAGRHQREGTRPVGRKAIQRQHPHHQPKSSKRSHAPLAHSASKAVRKQYETAYRLLVAAYRAAAERLRRGEVGVSFPEGTFPPGLPFVPYTREPRAG